MHARRFDVHDLIAKLEETFGFKRLREEVGEVGVTAHEGDAEAVRLDGLADVEVASLDVLELAMVLGVVSGGDGGLVVDVKLLW